MLPGRIEQLEDVQEGVVQVTRLGGHSLRSIDWFYFRTDYSDAKLGRGGVHTLANYDIPKFSTFWSCLWLSLPNSPGSVFLVSPRCFSSFILCLKSVQTKAKVVDGPKCSRRWDGKFFAGFQSRRGTLHGSRSTSTTVFSFVVSTFLGFFWWYYFVSFDCTWVGSSWVMEVVSAWMSTMESHIILWVWRCNNTHDFLESNLGWWSDM